MKDLMNEIIIAKGTIVTATKLPVITIGIGKVAKLQDVPNVIWKNASGEVVIKTKEKLDGCVYDQDRTAVVRVIGGKVLINGLYDIYAPETKKLGKLLSNPISLEAELSAELIKQLTPVLEAGTDVTPSLAPAEPGRKVIVIDAEILNGAESIKCVCSWGDEAELYAGDVFVVEDAENFKGYRIGKEEFEETHSLD